MYCMFVYIICITRLQFLLYIFGIVYVTVICLGSLVYRLVSMRSFYLSLVFSAMNFPIIDYVIKWKEHVHYSPDLYRGNRFARNARLIIGFCLSFGIYSVHILIEATVCT